MGQGAVVKPQLGSNHRHTRGVAAEVPSGGGILPKAEAGALTMEAGVDTLINRIIQGRLAQRGMGLQETELY